ncbi:folylpolyglutamate synthase/dihydrofolate synthase family protein [Pseudovibrio sp. Tun.PSC04-5.I4]|uniref:bifunctional folylpolyglutamate synthase/dihydrofolate synthase n=1 Tax=Pseudovibrio sp. Tun.PSC04-5.I4 TaxID=1798213 RepID=UPI000890F0DA|nr:folylpolyglutamate synthase/dihydrofolate synthase family protein [Pseudovibrio sp. Tun.PSC04-5.I4]SDR26234.1 dihydrofolate synthase / folylpolyglutamate synthase [Pseudovibrio sp. Tun.PSC04-5.I4]
MNKINAALDRLMKLHPDEINLSLDRMLRILKALGSPEKSVPPIFHIAGTNGKGSTGASIRALLEAQGKRVHVYSSPHLVRFNERIRLGSTGKFVDDDALLVAIERVEKANGGEELTFFEATTAVAFCLFADTPADYLVLEVGLGGVLDATNVIEKPLVSVITPISKDHENFLGNSLEGIALEKAGIIKPGCPVVVGPQTDAIRDLIENTAGRLRAPVWFQGQEFSAWDEGGRLVYQDELGLLDLSPPKLAGFHQISNSGLALAAIRAAGLLEGDDAQNVCDKALRSINWPARMQPLYEGALFDELPKNCEIWVDGGHNPGAAEVIASFLADLTDKASRPTYLVMGMMNTKDPEGFFEQFEGLAKHVLCVPLTTTQAGRSPIELAEIAKASGLSASAHGNLDRAIAEISRRSKLDNEAPRILFGGSLYLAGEILARNGTLPE